MKKAFLVDVQLQTSVVIDTEGLDEVGIESQAMHLAMHQFIAKLPYEGYENMEVSDVTEVPYQPKFDGE